MPSARGLDNLEPAFPSLKQVGSDVSSIVWGGVAPVAGFGRNVASKLPSAGRFFRFGARKAPKVPPRPGGIRANPAQAGEEVVHAVQEAASPAAAHAPLAGRTNPHQFQVEPPRPIPRYAKTALAVGGGAAGVGFAYKSLYGGGGGGGDAPSQSSDGPLETIGGDLGAALRGTLGGVGAGLAELFAGGGAGAGAGVGAGAFNALAGVGAGLKKVALPVALIGAGFLVFTALKKR